ncbi:MAG: ABC transporter substrate-binding protein [Betaproteobacteria bacterium]|nr:ABC transporter substrate-binding protein [Betaproteobacteria bacterium]
MRAIALGLPALAFHARAQQPGRQHRIGLLLPNTPEIVARNPRMAAFLQGLRDLGWIEGQNIVIERRFAEGQLARLADLAADLARVQVEVIVTAAAPSAVAAKAATHTVPIVMLDPGDPVGSGLVESLARPGGNITGVTSIAPDLAAKRLGLLKEAAPKITHVAVLSNAAIPPAEIAMQELQAAAKVLGLRVRSVAAQGSKGLDDAFRLIVQERADGVIVFPDPLTFSNQEKIVSFAAASRIPVMFGAREFVEAGGFMSYGPSYPDMFRRGAHYVDRILKGAKPADLPVEQPTRFELVVNLKTAQALGLIIPQSILLRADRVIE